MQFCVTTYVTQNVILPEDLIPKLGEWGYDGIELWGGRPYQVGRLKWGLEGRTQTELEQLKKLVEEQGLEVPVVSPYFKFTSGEEDYKNSLQKAKRYCELAKFYSAKVIRVLGEGIPSAKMTEDNWKAFIRGLKDLAALGNEYGVVFGLELHPDTPHDTVLGQLRCIWQTGSPKVRALYQPSTTSELEPEIDPLWALEMLYSYIRP
jgi:sugar phosphate isomerase/epimerase